MLQASQGHQLIQTSNGQHILVQAAIQQQQTPTVSSAQQNTSAAQTVSAVSNGQPAPNGASNGSGQPTQQTAIQVRETIKKGFFVLFYAKQMTNNENLVDQSLYNFFYYNRIRWT